MRYFGLLIVGSFLAIFIGAGSATAAITTGGSVWQNTYSDGDVFYRVGESANGWMILDGGSTFSREAIRAGGVNATGNITVDGPGTVMTATQQLRLGVNTGGYGTLDVQNGAHVYGYITSVGIHGYGAGGRATIDGAGSRLSAHGLSVGDQGAGTLNITNGGQVDVALHVRAGQYPTWNQNAVTYSQINVSGQGSRLLVGDGMRLGVMTYGYGDPHVTLNISDGGLVRLGGDLDLAEGPTTTAIVNIDGGTLDMQGHSITRGAGTSEFNFSSGTIANVGGFTGGLHQKGGRLAAGSSPGTMPIGGDYILDSGAVLEVEVGNIIAGAGIGYDFYDVVGTAALAGTLDALPYTGFTTRYLGETVDVLTATTIDTTGLTITNSDLFAYDVVAGGNGEILQLTIIPEPAAGLILLAGLPMVLRRRVSWS